MLHRKHKYDLIVVFSLLAFGVSIFLAVSSAAHLTVPCSITGGCEAVLSSKYSKLLGFPLSYWGVVYFAGVVVTGLLANHYHFGKKLLTWYLGIGLLSSLCFLGIQFFIIRQVCQYCLVTDLLAIALFLWDFNIEHLPKAA